MLNVGNRRREQLEQQKVGGLGAGLGGMLSMYNDAPLVEVSLEEFEQFAIDRLHVLKGVESFRLRGGPVKEREVKLDKILNKHLPLRGPTPATPKRGEQDALKDVLSHFFLRMAFCQTEELRRWFLTQESTLFRYRLDKMTREEKVKFMQFNGLSYPEATASEIDALQSELRAVRDATNDRKDRSKPLPSYFKVPFTDALDLVSHRKVFLANGVAYVPFEHVVSILFAAFRANLSKQLASAFRRYNQSPISKDERLAPVLSNLAKHHTDADFSASQASYQSASQITPSMLDGLAKTSMPLCMRSLHKALKVHHHLKYQGRQQYGLFLKGAGLELDDAIAFWRSEFCKKLTVEDFNKKYAYNIRHNYGKEGKRKDYTPFNCMRIITGEAPKTGEYHGCPFRHFEREHLRKMMKDSNPTLEEKDLSQMLDLASSSHYQVACKRHFEVTHPGQDEEVVVSHPNAYFEASRKYYEKREMKE